jgi:tetratricopeptide (TPR) repeat protein
MIFKESKMKKILILVCSIVFSGSLPAQEAVDYILRARALTGEGKPEQSIALINKAMGLFSDSRLNLERAEAYLKSGDLSAAINDFSEADKLEASSGEYGLARVYAIKGDAPTALYHLELNLKSKFRKSEKEILLDNSFSRIENKPEWRQFWKKEWYTALERSLSEIEYYNSAGKSDESRTILADLNSQYPGNDAVTYGRAETDLASGKTSEALKAVSGLLSGDPGNEKYLRLMARAQTAASNPAGASATYSQLIASGIADAELFIQRAECYRKTGEFEKALKDIERYLVIYPESSKAIRLAGKTEAASGDNLRAIEYFSKNLKLYPDEAQCYIDRGDSYFISKTWNWAINDYAMSLDLKPGNADVYMNKGIALLNTGKTEDACIDFRRSLSLGNKKVADYINRHCIR